MFPIPYEVVGVTSSASEESTDVAAAIGDDNNVALLEIAAAITTHSICSVL